jgi:hypothetical protein
MDFADIRRSKTVAWPIYFNQFIHCPELLSGFDFVHFPLALDAQQVFQNPPLGAGFKLGFIQSGNIISAGALHIRILDGSR